MQIKYKVFLIFIFFRKSMTIVYNDMLLGFFLNKFSLLTFILFLKLEFKFIIQDLIAMLKNTEIFKSLCFRTWRFKYLCGLNMEIFESLYFNTWRFKNLCVLEHRDFVRQSCSYFPISVF